MFIHFFNWLDNCSRLETRWRGHILYYLAYNRTESAFSIEQHEFSYLGDRLHSA